MPGRNDTMTPETSSSLASALRALPQQAPQPDLWPELAQALARRRRRGLRRCAVPIAAAAALAVFVLLPRWHAAPPIAAVTPLPPMTSAAPAAAPGDAPAGELDALHQRSQSLERWIAAFTANAPQDSRDLMAAVEVEDLIGLVDVQLDAARGDADALPLWRQRVALLQDLATIRGNAYAVASNETGASHSAPQMLN